MDTTIKLTGVRLSFPALFTPKAFKSAPGEQPKTPGYSASFILDKKEHAKLIKDIKRIIDHLVKTELKKNRLPSDKVCLRDGEDKEDVDGYGPDVMYLSSGSRNRPAVVDRKANDITEESGMVYAGCYVNASVRLWAQNNDFGKRVNAELRGVQFLRDGDPFGGDRFDPKEEFGSVEDDDDDYDVGADDDDDILD